MRNTPNVKTERWRIHKGMMASLTSDGNNGAFLVNCGKEVLTVIASDGLGWDHVSVSLRHRCPTWEEMSFVKDLFFRDDEVVFQFHPAKKDHINCHPNCLHLWRPHLQQIPMPPPETVGPQLEENT